MGTYGGSFCYHAEKKQIFLTPLRDAANIPLLLFSQIIQRLGETFSFSIANKKQSD